MKLVLLACGVALALSIAGCKTQEADNFGLAAMDAPAPSGAPIRPAKRAPVAPPSPGDAPPTGSIARTRAIEI
jgi:hypothetical protein